MANGIKIGEVDQHSAIVWTRLTRHAERNKDGIPFTALDGREGKGLDNLDAREGSVPGVEGEVRIVYWLADSPENRHATAWQKVDAGKDYTHQIPLRDLTPGKQYALLVEGRPIGSETATCKVEGAFRTPPSPETAADVRFVVVTCQTYHNRDDRENGHKIYSTMRALDPDFFVHTGDIEYYDLSRPYATTVAAARFKWNRIYGMPFQRTFHEGVTSYFMKDDHDTLKNDCYPGQTYGDVTFQHGQELFREQVPMGEKTYRTIRWGKDLQIWLVEGRDFRSPNNSPDGPDKTILGKEQKQWLFDTVSRSDATFRVLICPTPVVGPGTLRIRGTRRARRQDNHSEMGFATEGNELREFIGRQKNMYVFSGDRHWQSASIDAKTGVWDFGCGPSSDSHVMKFVEGDDNTAEAKLAYVRSGGGFLRVEVDRDNGVPRIHMRHCDVDGGVHHHEVFLSHD
ncbi:MAG: alkaline phosphatase [Pirellulaceae bacterium]|nr:alkaline phosphatase [Pirellulaceae bacterium]